MRAALIALFMLGCGGGNKPAPATPAASPTTTAAADPNDPGRKPTEAECKAAVDKTLTIARTDPTVDAGLKEGGKEAEMRSMGMTECTSDWIGATVDCVMESETVPDVDTCMRNQENRSEQDLNEDSETPQ